MRRCSIHWPGAIRALILITLACAPGAAQCKDWSPQYSMSGQGLDAAVHALCVGDLGAGPRLFAVGEFTQSNGVPAAHVAAWDGMTWAALGAGLSGPAYAIALYDDGTGVALYVGGDFTFAGGQPAARIARWNGATWSSVGSGVNGTVRALHSFDDGSGSRLFAGGEFTLAGGQDALRIAAWKAGSWSSVGDGFDLPVRALASWDDGTGTQLYAGGDFQSSQVGGPPVRGIARWTTTRWVEVGGGIAPQTAAVHCLLALNGRGGLGSRLWVGGSFAQAGGQAHTNLAAWNGTSWSSPPQKPNAAVRSLARFDAGLGPVLAAGGDFTHVGSLQFDFVGLWDGSLWNKLGLGLGPEIPPARCSALAQFDQVLGPRLYAGGEFVEAGGMQSLRIARWSDPCSSPQFLQQPVDQVAVFYDPVSFQVEVQGTLPISYQWRRDGIPLVDKPGVEGTVTPRLTLYEWDWDDRGAYDCLVSNASGSVISDGAQLTVPGGGLMGEPLEVVPVVLPPQTVGNLPSAKFTEAREPVQAPTDEAIFLGQLDIGGDGLARLAGGSTELLYRQGDPAPGLPFGLTLGSLSLFESPFRDFVIGAEGRLEFSADLAGPNVGPDNRTGIWMRDGASTHLVAREGDPVVGSGAGSVLRDPSAADMSNGGSVVFRGSAYKQGSFVHTGAWVWSTINGQQLLLKQGDILPGVGAVLKSLRSRPRISGEGRVLVEGEIDSVTGWNYGSLRDTALWFGAPGALQLVAKSGDPAPGMPAGSNLEFFADDSALADDAGRVAFTTWVAGPGGFYHQGLFLWDSGSLVPVAVFGQQAPGASEGSVFSNPRVLALSATALVFESSLATTCDPPCTKNGVWVYTGGALHPIVLDGQDPYAGVPPIFAVGAFGSAAVDASSRVLLELSLAKDGSSWSAVVGWTADRGLFPVLVPGMQLEVAPDDFRMVLNSYLPAATGNTGDRDSRNLSPAGTVAVETTFNEEVRALIQEPLSLFASFQLGPGIAYCFGNGSGTSCPCGNPGGSVGGCANSSGQGAVFQGTGSIRISEDSLAFTMRAAPANAFSLLFEGTLAPNGGAGLPFSDGLICAGGTTNRLQGAQANANGIAKYGPGLAAAGHWTAGSTWNFQVWYRDTTGPCGQGSNLSNGYRVTFLP